MLQPPHLTKQAFLKFFPTKFTGGSGKPLCSPGGSCGALKPPKSIPALSKACTLYIYNKHTLLLTTIRNLVVAVCLVCEVQRPYADVICQNMNFSTFYCFYESFLSLFTCQQIHLSLYLSIYLSLFFFLSISLNLFF